MTLGLRGLLLLVAVILFIVAAVTDGETAFNLLCIGLACVAGAFLAEELGGVGFRFGTTRTGGAPRG